MKKILLSVITISFLSLNAQIFINTNPNTKTTETSTTKTEAKTTVTETKETVKENAVETKAEVETVSTPIKTEVKTTVTETKEEVKTVSTPVKTEVKTTVVETKEETKEIKSATPVRTTSTAVTTPKSTPTTTTSSNTTTSLNQDVPPNAEPGKCYARCVIEDKYTLASEKVVDQPTLIKKVKKPAVYKTVYDTVVISPATTKSIQHSAEYKTVKEEVMVTPATTKWVKGKADAACLSANPADCEVMCLVEIPAVYKTVDKKVLLKEAYTSTEAIPVQYKVTAKEVKVQDESLIDEVTSATYKTVQKKVLQEKGGLQVWREILCGDDLTAQKILAIQKALKANGYNPGPIDNVFGAQTKAALIQYQKDKALPIGNLNLETLRALGVN